jgi:hypothetical protein
LGFAGRVTLSFGPDDFVNNPADAGLVVASRSSATDSWRNLGRSGNGPDTQTGTGPGGPFVSGSVVSGPLNPFSTFFEFTLGATNNTGIIGAVNPLPVQLSRFSAQRQGSAVAVNWATASEVNSAHFEVQRSLDGREFVTVATVAAQGGTRPTSYSALDRTAPATLLYYRLRQVDRDGTSAHSPVVMVGGSGSVAKVLLYPNPARSSINFAAETATPYRVLNQLGQPLLRGTAPAGSATVALDALAPGLYFMELQIAAGRVVQKFEKE